MFCGDCCEMGVLNTQSGAACTCVMLCIVLCTNITRYQQLLARVLFDTPELFQSLHSRIPCCCSTVLRCNSTVVMLKDTRALKSEIKAFRLAELRCSDTGIVRQAPCAYGTTLCMYTCNLHALQGSKCTNLRIYKRRGECVHICVYVCCFVL